jgi:hypothetical protein
MTALAKASSNCKRQARPLVREGAPHQQTRTCLTVTRIWSWATEGFLTPRQTVRVTIGGNITLTLTTTLKFDSWSNELVVRQSPVGKNANTETENIVGIRHQAKTGEDIAN